MKCPICKESLVPMVDDAIECQMCEAVVHDYCFTDHILAEHQDVAVRGDVNNGGDFVPEEE